MCRGPVAILLLFGSLVLQRLLLLVTGVLVDDSEKERLQGAASRLVAATRSLLPKDDAQARQLEQDWNLVLGALHLLEGGTDEEQMEHFIQDAKKEATIDRHVKGILNIYNDTDCLEREFDASSESFRHEIRDAIAVFAKCRILVLRNLYSKRTIRQTLGKHKRYMDDINTGRILQEGTTTFGGHHFILKEDQDRLNYMATRDLVQQSPDVFANPYLIQILSHPTVLGDDFILNHAGTINSWPTGTGRNRQRRRRKAKPQYWHFDGEYVHANHHDHPQAASAAAVAGHDLPPFAINLFTPLLNLTAQHGPTEFCIGTSWLRGIDLESALHEPPPQDHKSIVRQLLQFEYQWQIDHGNPSCPAPLSRTPILNMGDVVLFDYMVTHRGGANASDQLRSLLFATYSRKWLRDTTFDGGWDDDDQDCHPHDLDCELDYLSRLTRFAVVQRAHSRGGNNDDHEL